MINTLIFDIGGVIINQESFPDFDELDEKYGLKPRSAEKIFSEYFKELKTPASSIVLSDIEKEILRTWIDDERINTELIDWIRKAKDRFTISALSNSTIGMEEMRKRNIIPRDIFSHYFSSADTGLVKPDSKFFVFALNSLQKKPSETLFIDDNPMNTASASKLGMNTHLFVNNSGFFELINTYQNEPSIGI